MPMNTMVDTTGMERMEPVKPALPALPELTKPAFYRGPMPTTAIVNPDAIRNFSNTGIPTYRINLPLPLNLL
jgi:hypothetical protein